MVEHTKATGSPGRYREPVSTHGQMVVDTSVNTPKARSMAMAPTHGSTDAHTEAIGTTERCTEKAKSFLVMVVGSPACGAMAISYPGVAILLRNTTVAKIL
jgi:hypothetical protein